MAQDLDLAIMELGHSITLRICPEEADIYHDLIGETGSKDVGPRSPLEFGVEDAIVAISPYAYAVGGFIAAMLAEQSKALISDATKEARNLFINHLKSRLLGDSPSPPELKLTNENASKLMQQIKKLGSERKIPKRYVAAMEDIVRDLAK